MENEDVELGAVSESTWLLLVPVNNGPIIPRTSIEINVLGLGFDNDLEHLLRLRNDDKTTSVNEFLHKR